MFQPVYNPKEPAPAFPPIFGTGFIVDDGLVVTNDHVINAIPKLPKPKNCPPDVWPVQCLLWHYIPDKGMATIHLDVLGLMKISHVEHGDIYYGPPKPDIAFVHVKMRELPRVDVKYNLKEIQEGREVATAGFPMGTETLTAPGYLHQLTPTLQEGIISAVLPFQCEKPHALMVNVMVQGGASGSPIFLPDTGDVIGILYAGLEETRQTKTRLPEKIEPLLHTHIFSTPTNISYVVPAHYIEAMLIKLKNDKAITFPDDTLTLEEYLKKAEYVDMKRGEAAYYEVWKEEKIAKRTIEIKKPHINDK